MLAVFCEGVVHGQPDAHQHGTPASPAPAQAMPSQERPMTAMSFGGIPDSREASGTAWQPDATPMHAHHAMFGAWRTMAHYNVFLAYDDQSGPRGDEQLNSINWFMLMATKRTEENELTLRTMLSLEPWTTTGKGYPLLFQSGEAYHGSPLVDRQHPHDLFMELAARYRRVVADKTLFSLYIAPAGEPALGPPAFPHRMSAMDNPAAPSSHHWIDSTHISFGALTAGINRDKWQLEGSWFNGREPDEDRWDIEKPNLDSFAGRLAWNPTREWSVQISHGYLKSPEELHPRDHVYRTTASLMNLTKLSAETHVATTAAWGRNDKHGSRSDAFLIETNYMMPMWSFFARAEYVEKGGEELQLLPPENPIRVRQFSAGLTRELLRSRSYQLAAGAAVTYTATPRGSFGTRLHDISNLDRIYGKEPTGVWLFLRLRPAAMAH
jgi:hypothetical protein